MPRPGPAGVPDAMTRTMSPPRRLNTETPGCQFPGCPYPMSCAMVVPAWDAIGSFQPRLPGARQPFQIAGQVSPKVGGITVEAASGGGKALRKLNATAVGPLDRSSSSLAIASGILGRWPRAIHQSTKNG